MLSMADDLIEYFAIRAALGNNGGTWAEHYTEDQKEHWRQGVRDMAAAMRAASDYDSAPTDHNHGGKVWKE